MIHHNVFGDGPPLVFIHGFCETGNIWNSLIPKISKEFQIITLDLPGFGKSDLAQSEISIEEIGIEINDWLYKNGFRNSVLMGHSLGGYVTLAMVAQNPELFSGFGLVHSTAKADTADKKQNRLKVISFVEAHGVAPYVDSFIPGLFYDKENAFIEFAYQIALQTPMETLISYTKAMANRPSREAVLENSAVPVLLIAGQEDTVIDVSSLEEQSRLNARISFHVLPKVGHMGMFEDGDRLANLINTFASQVRNDLRE